MDAIRIEILNPKVKRIFNGFSKFKFDFNKK